MQTYTINYYRHFYREIQIRKDQNTITVNLNSTIYSARKNSIFIDGKCFVTPIIKIH